MADIILSEINFLNYEICDFSSYSTTYLPENIREDCPSNQSSRWSSNTNHPPQYLTLKLDRPAIVRRIKFGKYEKNHVCNLRKFKIYGGLKQNNLILLFEGGLRNDTLSETFDLKCTTGNDKWIPSLYIHIVPLLSWGPSFNFSIWYVELQGQDDAVMLEPCLKEYNDARESDIVRYCLKHFRDRGYENAFQTLQNETNIHLEHPMVTDLHESLVVNGDFPKVERLLEHSINQGFMDTYLTKQDYKAIWILKESCNPEERPGMRGGHQLIIDSTNGMMYLYGGWDGCEDLSDLWSYDIKKNTWTLIQDRSELYDGPTPRSCHKMVFDPCNSQIFILGRYLDSSSRTPELIKSDFYLYDTRTNTWLLICDDTSQMGGPHLIFDHQMCIDIAKKTIYVFGGKILMPRDVNDLSNEPLYSGLFSYHIGTNTWTRILVDSAHPAAHNPEILSIRSRVTHSMLFHYRHRKLYIFGGQRNKEHLNDFLSFDVDTHELTVVHDGYANIMDPTEIPQSGFTQRATIDCERDEIYMLSSLSKDKERRDYNLNSFWVYTIKKKLWTCVYKSDHSNANCCQKNESFNDSTCIASATGNSNLGELPSSSSSSSSLSVRLSHRLAIGAIGRNTSSLSSSFSIASASSMMAAYGYGTEPCPRYAHQLVYDWVNHVHYLFGGNPGKNTIPNLRLDDFWILQLNRLSRQQLLRHCKYLVRKVEYEEIAKRNVLNGIQYLQTKFTDIIDKNDSTELKEFHKLATLLFQSDMANLIKTLKESALDKCEVPEIELINCDSLVCRYGGHNGFGSSSATSSSSSSSSVTFKMQQKQYHQQLLLRNSTSSSSSTTATTSTTSNNKIIIDECLHKYKMELHEIKKQRCLLYNKFIDMLPQSMVQPNRILMI